MTPSARRTSTASRAYHLGSPKSTKFDDFEPLERQDGATAIRSEIGGLGAVDDFEGRFEDLKIDVLGSVAIATADFDYGFVAEGEHTDVCARTTFVLVESDGEWRIAHEHLSPFKANLARRRAHLSRRSVGAPCRPGSDSHRERGA